MIMKEQLISFETAKLAKEKGFPFINDYNLKWYNSVGELEAVDYPGDESLSDYFSKIYLKDGKLYNPWDESEENTTVRYEDDLYLAPTQSLLKTWIRKKYNIFIRIIYDIKGKCSYEYSCHESIRHRDVWNRDNIFYDTEEEALEEGLFRALELIKENKTIFNLIE